MDQIEALRGVGPGVHGDRTGSEDLVISNIKSRNQEQECCPQERGSRAKTRACAAGSRRRGRWENRSSADNGWEGGGVSRARGALRALTPSSRARTSDHLGAVPSPSS